MSNRNSVLEVFNINNNSNPKKYINVCAPMVRYSKLPFRELVRGYNVDLTYTPMILAKEFKNSNIARNSDFTTNKNDKPLIIQFASNDNVELLKAVELIVGYVDGIDVNCGCPQKWAINEGIGVYLMEKPEKISDMIRTIKTNIPTLPCSIKIRIHNDLKKTIEFVKRAESIGIDFITVHGRTPNGNIFTLNDAEDIYNQTGVNGVMCARGLLRNPALFAGYDLTPWDCVENFVRLSIAYGSNHFILHHHLMYMFEDVMSNAEKKSFNTLTSIPAIIDHLEEYYGLQLE
ncbi:9712_t:CDS:2 [Funneliformis caledonium]|uniref:tRNA-dihydrouridine synthase n=1 Tax=Funneliformis caledonium TaxID=1117310 RepID=A0A9N9G770_9GLOM|nr:9712_t:CDS:2 [Funneliformis caledonium]